MNIGKMDLLKENAENMFALNTRNVKDNLVGFKQMKQALKPLSDVKNILVGNLCVGQNQTVKSDVETTAKVLEEEYGYDDLYFYKDDMEDNYEDIIPRSLQLNKDDIARLATVFDQNYFIGSVPLADIPLEPISLKHYDDDDEDFYNHFKVDVDPSADLFEVETELILY